jgi:hypothetical protein
MIYHQTIIILLIKNNLKPLVFWNVTRRMLVVVYRRLGTANGSHFQGSRSRRRM